MNVGKLKPTATIAAQFPAGVEVECIQHEGKLFLPVMNLCDFGAIEPQPEKPSAKLPKKTEPVATDDDDDDAPTEGGKETVSYKEKDLMDMSTKELSKILLSMDIDPDDFDGKNTNKKLRLLILENQDEEKPTKKGKGKSSKKDEEEEETPETSEANEEVISILEDFDSGSINQKKALSKLLALSEELSEKDKKKVTKILTEFADDDKADIDEIAVSLTEILWVDDDDDDDDEEEAKPKKSKKEKYVEAEELKKGQRVSVYWEDNEEWYEGTVKSNKKGVVVVDYDDETTEEIDPENNTKIKLL